MVLLPLNVIMVIVLETLALLLHAQLVIKTMFQLIVQAVITRWVVILTLLVSRTTVDTKTVLPGITVLKELIILLCAQPVLLTRVQV